MTRHLLGIPDLPLRAFQRTPGGTIKPQGGGKGGTPDAPDYGPMAAASKEAAEIGAALGQKQLDENRRQYEDSMAVAKPVIEAQKGIMDQTMQQGQDYYDYSKNTFRPIEQSLADEAMSGTSRYNTNAGVRASAEEEATRAAADTARASANAEQQNNRAAISMGVNPNSGRFAALNVGNSLAKAGMNASAMTNARNKAVQLDYAKRLDVTGLGRGLPGASQGAYQVATGAGSNAVGNQNATASQYINGMAGGTGTIMQGQGMNISGLGNVLNSQTSVYNAQMNNQGDGGLGAIGAIAGTAGAIF